MLLPTACEKRDHWKRFLLLRVVITLKFGERDAMRVYVCVPVFC